MIKAELDKILEGVPDDAVIFEGSTNMVIEAITFDGNNPDEYDTHHPPFHL